jgi:hypothetical protein
MPNHNASVLATQGNNALSSIDSRYEGNTLAFSLEPTLSISIAINADLPVPLSNQLMSMNTMRMSSPFCHSSIILQRYVPTLLLAHLLYSPHGYGQSNT